MMNAFVENVRKKIKVPPSSNSEKKKRKSKKKGEKVEDFEPGVVYIGHIPHGFFEKEMRKYFSQFGKVQRLRIARSRKTGRSKGYAFVEFQSSEVAKIVAETMNNYLFFEKLLKCEYVPADKVRPNTFRRRSKTYTTRIMNKEKLNRPKDPEIVAKNNIKRVKRMKKLKESLNGMGIKFNMKPFVVKEEKLK